MNYDEYIEAWTFPEREVVHIDCGQGCDYDEISKQVAVIDVEYEGKHFVAIPFAHEGELTIEVAVFDRAGERMINRLFTVSDVAP